MEPQYSVSAVQNQAAASSGVGEMNKKEITSCFILFPCNNIANCLSWI